MTTGLLAAAADKVSRLIPSLPVWGSWLGLFLVLELTPMFWKGCPWETLSGTVWDAESWWHFTRLLIGVFLLVLAAHFAWHVPVDWLIACAVGAGVAVTAHIFVPHL